MFENLVNITRKLDHFFILLTVGEKNIRQGYITVLHNIVLPKQGN